MKTINLRQRNSNKSYLLSSSSESSVSATRLLSTVFVVTRTRRPRKNAARFAPTPNRDIIPVITPLSTYYKCIYMFISIANQSFHSLLLALHYRLSMVQLHEPENEYKLKYLCKVVMKFFT